MCLGNTWRIDIILVKQIYFKQKKRIKAFQNDRLYFEKEKRKKVFNKNNFGKLHSLFYPFID